MTNNMYNVKTSHYTNVSRSIVIKNLHKFYHFETLRICSHLVPIGLDIALDWRSFTYIFLSRSCFCLKMTRSCLIRAGKSPPTLFYQHRKDGWPLDQSKFVCMFSVDQSQLCVCINLFYRRLCVHFFA